MKTLALLMVGWLAACGGGSSTPSDGGGNDGGATDGSAVIDAARPDGGGGTCRGAGFSGGEPTVSITSVATQISEVGGTPVANLPVFIRSLSLVSSPGKTDASGNAALTFNQSLKAPHLRFGDGLQYPLLQIPLGMAVTTTGPLFTAPLPATGMTMTPGATVTSGPLTLTLAAGTVVQVDTLTFDTPDKQGLRAVTLPPAQFTRVIEGNAFEVLVGVAPAATTFCPPAAATLPNSPGWPAGAAVEFYLSGDDVGQEWAPLAGWAKVSDGQVSADGLTIKTAAGGGLPVLGTIAVKRKP